MIESTMLDQKPSKRRNTSRFKQVPPTRQLRDSLQAQCAILAAGMDQTHPYSKSELESLTRGLLKRLGEPEGYLGWMMVVLATAFWKNQVAAIPFERRLFLLPHCLKHAEGCPADYDEFGLDCRKCGACSIADFRARAETLGYKVLVAEGSPIVMKIIVGGYVDAIVGVACLNVLEKAIDKILLAGIPCLAVPLLSSDCRNTSVDEDWVSEIIETPHAKPSVQTRSYLHLLRAASGLFETNELDRLVPRVRKSSPLPQAAESSKLTLDPISATEAIAYDFLSKGGKHSRPFITLAAYDALQGGSATTADGAEHIKTWPDAIRRVAMSIETFHKASLVHDDIEDDDEFRYGEPTVHRRFGVPTAINVGDYLIGLGYRLVSRDSATLTPGVAADILDRLADAHLKLAEGQGAELLWRDSSDKRLTPLDALKIYALKTAPAFEAALYSGIRLAGPVDAGQSFVAPFARNLGIAFQIRNDLNDWRGDTHNKLHAMGDISGGRPTVLWALALEGLSPRDQEELLSLVANKPILPATVARIRALYESAGAFDKAERLIDKHQERAEAIADEVQPEELRRLLYYLVDSVLERPVEEPVQLLTLELPTLGSSSAPA